MYLSRGPTLLFVAFCIKVHIESGELKLRTSRGPYLMNKLTNTSHCFVVFAVLFLLVAAAQTFAQEKWRPIPPADLQAGKPVVEPDADAEALIWEERLDDSYSDKVKRTTYVRIKIFTERGRERFSKLDVGFIKGIAKIKDLSARITQPDGKSVELGEKDIFDRDVAKTEMVKLKAKALAFPNLAPGVILEYQYTEMNENIYSDNATQDLQLDLPVQTLNFYYKPFRGREPKYTLLNVEDLKFEKAEDGYYRITRKNVPAFRAEPWMPPETETRQLLKVDRGWYPSMNIDLSKRQILIFKNSGGRTKDTYWANYASWQKPLADELNRRKKDFTKLTREVIGDATTPEEKLRRIYEFCQTRINNTSYGYNPNEDEIDKAWDQRVLTEDDFKTGKPFANSREIDAVFGAMAAAAGFDPWYAMTGRRDISFFTPDMSDSSLLSGRTICIVFGGSPHLYMPGIKYMPFGMVPWYFEGAVAMYTDGKQYGWWEIPMNTFEKNNTRRSGKFRLTDDGTLEGTATIELTGQPALSYRLAHHDEEPQERDNALKMSVQGRITNGEITNISIENFDDTSKPLIRRFTIKVPHYAQKTGKRMFFQPGFFEYGTSAAFATSTRKYDMFFRYPWSENDDIEIALPSGYSLDNLEAPKAVVDTDQIARDEVQFDFETSMGKMLYKRKFYFGNKNLVTFKASSYSGMKTLWDRFHTADTTLVSLRANE